MELFKNGALPTRAARCLHDFLTLIDTLDQVTETLSLSEQVERVLSDSGLRDHFKKEKTEKGLARLENLNELVTAMRQFEAEYPAMAFVAYDEEESQQKALPPREQMQLFLVQIALDAGGDASDEGEGKSKVHMMTLHAAKGLEFPVVFLSGLEQGLFPHQLSLQEPDRLEEERRLCYVGMTRAKQKLFLTYAETRRVHGRENFNLPSPFIVDIPKELIEELPSTSPDKRGLGSGSHYASASSSYAKRSSNNYRQRYAQSTPTSSPQSVIKSHVSRVIEDTALTIGQAVKHPKFGAGTILNYEGRGAHARVQVKFGRAGVKWLVLSYANLYVE